MKFLLTRISITYLILLTSILSLTAQETSDPFVYGDTLPDAPALAARGAYAVGVRTMDLVHKDQVDILNAKEGEAPLYDRPLKIEVWYPALVDEAGLVLYE